MKCSFSVIKFVNISHYTPKYLCLASITTRDTFSDNTSRVIKTKKKGLFINRRVEARIEELERRRIFIV